MAYGAKKAISICGGTENGKRGKEREIRAKNKTSGEEAHRSRIANEHKRGKKEPTKGRRNKRTTLVEHSDHATSSAAERCMRVLM